MTSHKKLSRRSHSDYIIFCQNACKAMPKTGNKLHYEDPYANTIQPAAQLLYPI